MPLHPYRALKVLVSIVRLVRDPDRLGEVFEISNSLATPKTLAPILEGLAKNPALAAALDERHRIRIDLNELRKLPERTLGRTFAEHMIAAKLDPSALPSLRGDDRASYFRAHLYETHDIWHVMTGFGTDPVGELGLQAFYLAQIPGPLPSLLLSIGFLRVGIFEQKMSDALMDSIVRGWRMGKVSKPFFGVHWDERWSDDLSSVRREFGIRADDVLAGGVSTLAA